MLDSDPFDLLSNRYISRKHSGPIFRVLVYYSKADSKARATFRERFVIAIETVVSSNLSLMSEIASFMDS